MSNQTTDMSLTVTLTESDLLKNLLPESKSKVEIDTNYILREVQKNPSLQKSDFLDHFVRCQLEGADPMRKQAYLSTFNSQVFNPVTQKKEYVTQGVTMFAYQFFLSKAEATGKYDSSKAIEGIGDYLNPQTGVISKQLYSEVTVVRTDKQHPTTFKAWYPEWVKTNKYGVTAFWKNSPYVMIRKCALSNALRQAFPQELGTFLIGDVDKDPEDKVVDLSKGDSIDVIPEPTQEPTQEPEEETPPMPTEEGEVVDASFTQEPETTPSSGDYVLQFGTHEGKKISELTQDVRLNLYTTVASMVQERGHANASKVVRDFYDNAKIYLNQ